MIDLGNGSAVGPVLAIGVGPMELIIVGLIVLLLFGSRLPGVMRSLGQSITEFKKGTREGAEDSDADPTNKST